MVGSKGAPEAVRCRTGPPYAGQDDARTISRGFHAPSAPAAAAAARAAGRAAAHAARAAGLAALEQHVAVAHEVLRQLSHMSAPVKRALRLLPPLGEDSSGPLGPGLLASGLQGTIVRDLQAGLADAYPAPAEARRRRLTRVARGSRGQRSHLDFDALELIRGRSRPTAVPMHRRDRCARQRRQRSPRGPMLLPRGRRGLSRTARRRRWPR